MLVATDLVPGGTVKRTGCIPGLPGGILHPVQALRRMKRKLSAFDQLCPSVRVRGRREQVPFRGQSWSFILRGRARARNAPSFVEAMTLHFAECEALPPAGRMVAPRVQRQTRSVVGVTSLRPVDRDFP